MAYGMDYLRKVQHKDYIFDNVHVYFLNYLNIPLFYFYSRDLWASIEYSAIIKFIKKRNLRFDYIHAHYTWPSGVVAAKLKKDINVPLIITEHTSETFMKAIRNKDSQFVKAWEISDSIIRVRRGDISLFHDVGISLDKIRNVTNGYDSNKFYPMDMSICRTKLGLPPDTKIILNVANLYSTVKGHEYLITAMSEVVNQRKNSLCIIIGEGKLHDHLVKLVDELGMKDYIKLVGSKNHDEIPQWINSCDLFVLPSLNEGNPTVMFECLGCGKPFIGTKVGGVPEIIVTEDYGLLCEPARSKELAENILLGLNHNWDSDLIKEYSSQFSWSSIAENIYKVYSQINSNNNCCH
ncbi:glycosyltransferase [Methanosarcina vacuolata]|uniref:glycosyltransferase n=1 Tax=Methanosarcina vacuolata TaxID=2215 RepID=UPI002FC38793